MREYICKCTNCGTLMYDDNPQIGQLKIDISCLSLEILPMELLQENGESFKGCGNCQTDGYLTDINSLDEITIKIVFGNEMWEAYPTGGYLPFHSETTYDSMCRWAKENGYYINETDDSNYNKK